jgi:hypothetical protein
MKKLCDMCERPARESSIAAGEEGNEKRYLQKQLVDGIKFSLCLDCAYDQSIGFAFVCPVCERPRFKPRTNAAQCEKCNPK